MKRITLPADDLVSISWFEDTIIDWVDVGKQYFLNGQVRHLGQYRFACMFDGAITSSNGKYAFIYQKLGTKGLLLKQGELIREINRSYYCANVYEYPAAFVTVKGITYLIHCPLAYNQLDFENVETGELVTNIPGRKPDDVFHSRLEISRKNTFLLSKGWLWHPLDVIGVFNVNDCLNSPELLDKSTIYPRGGSEICTASFINENEVLIGTSEEIVDEDNLDSLPPKHIAIWNLDTNQILKPVSVNFEFGNLFAIDENTAWDMFNYPKIINIHTGEIIDSEKAVNSGHQRSSIMNKTENYPQIVFNRKTNQVAISCNEKIEILTP